MLALETGRIDAYMHDEVGQFALLVQVNATRSGSRSSAGWCRLIRTA